MNLKNKEKLLVQPHYPLEFKRMVCELFLKGDKSKEEIRKEFDIRGKSTLLNWLRKLDYISNRNIDYENHYVMAKPQKESSVKSVEKEIEDLKLQLEMYKRMISLAEKEFKISIIKKSDTK